MHIILKSDDYLDYHRLKIVINGKLSVAKKSLQYLSILQIISIMLWKHALFIVLGKVTDSKN